MPRKQRSNPKTKHNAIKLRKEPTPAERKLWSRIRNDQLGVTFRRQHAVGNYIPDFCCPKAKLIIELDGLPSVAAPGTGRVRRRENRIPGNTGIPRPSLLEP